MTPELERGLPANFEERLERLEQFEREAAECATG
jgi:hypothetical protein